LFVLVVASSRRLPARAQFISPATLRRSRKRIQRRFQRNFPARREEQEIL
jgi:hypothetical protein